MLISLGQEDIREAFHELMVLSIILSKDLEQVLRHVYYENHIIDVEDSLPKFVDFPTELGGSGKRYD